MTKQQKWLKIAEAFATPFHERTETQHSLADSGLCAAASIMHMEGDRALLMQATRRTLLRAFIWTPRWERTGIRGDYIKPLAQDGYRSILACLLASMTDEERIQTLIVAERHPW